MSTEIQRTTPKTPTAPPQSIDPVLQLAITNGVDVEVIERLVALKERDEERAARAAFFEAIARFHEHCPPIVKTRENAQFQVTRAGVRQPARYAALEEIDRVARPVATECGLAWTWNTAVEGEMMHIDCKVIHVMGHSEVSRVTMPLESKAGSSIQQKFGSAQTYGMRYSLVAALGITTADEDLDGASNGSDAPGISDEQAADLEALIQEVGADRAKFLAHIKVKNVADIPAHDLGRIIGLLEQKRRGA